MECAVCLEDIDTETVTLPCKHVFCRECVLKLKQYMLNKCPLCRAPLPLNPEERRKANARRAVSDGVRALIRATSGESLNEDLLSTSIEKLEEAMKLDDSNLAARIALSNAWARRNPERALELAKDCVNRSKCAASLATLGLALERLNRIEAAIEQYERAIRRDSNHISAHASLAILLFRARRYEESIKMFDRTIEISPPNRPFLYYNKALALEAANRRDEALLTYKTAIARDPRHYPSLMNVGNLLMDLSVSSAEDNNAACRDAVRYYEKASKYAETIEKRMDAFLGSALFKNSDTRKHAVTVFGLLKTLMTSSSSKRTSNFKMGDVLICLGRSLKSMGRHTEAIKAYVSAIDHNESNSDAWINLGTLFGSTKRFESALHCFRIALDITKMRDDRVWLNQGIAQLDLNRVEEAKKSFKSCIDLNGDFASEARRLLDGL
eukprot:g7028.t1